jgi:hypothetical protein
MEQELSTFLENLRGFSIPLGKRTRQIQITKALTNGTTIEVTLSTQEKKSVKIPIDKEVQISL